MQFLKKPTFIQQDLLYFKKFWMQTYYCSELSLGNSSDVSDYAAQVCPIEGAARHRFTRCCGRYLWVSQIRSQVSQRTNFYQSVIHVFFHSAHCPRGLLVSCSETIALKRCNKNSVTYQRGTNQNHFTHPKKK